MTGKSENDPPLLDLRGLKCPLPVLRTRKALRAMAAGERLAVACTDPMAAIDIPNLVREEGDSLESRSDMEGTLRFVIRRGGASASFLLPVDG